jgi:hypothetical protein
MKLRHDFAGHYNRPDIFHLQINRAAPQLYSVHGGEDPALASARDAALASEASGQRGNIIDARAGHSHEPGSSARAAARLGVAPSMLLPKSDGEA